MFQINSLPTLRILVLAHGLLLCCGLVSAGAHARPTYPDHIPASPVDGRCGTCHVDAMGGGARNAFGLDAEATIDGDGPAWSSLFCMDSDGDGKTNGQELGDPCGAWTPGAQPARAAPLSAPGDPDDTVDVSDGDACDGEPPPVCAAPASAAGCSTGAAGAGPVALLLLACGRRLSRRRTVV